LDSFLNTKNGYVNFFSNRTDGVHGIFVAIRSSKFEVVESIESPYIDLSTGEKHPQVYQMYLLTTKVDPSNDCYILLGVTHLKAHVEGGQVRIEQAKQFISALDEMKSESLENHVKDKKLYTIISGDFNDHPDSEPLRIVKEGPNLKSQFDEEEFTKFYIKKNEKRSITDYIMFP